MNLSTLWPQGFREWLITKTSENLDVTFNIVNYKVLLKFFFLKQRSQFSLFPNYLPCDMACHTVHIDTGNGMIRNVYFRFQLSYMT